MFPHSGIPSFPRIEITDLQLERRTASLRKPVVVLLNSFVLAADRLRSGREGDARNTVTLPSPQSKSTNNLFHSKTLTKVLFNIKEKNFLTLVNYPKR